MKSSELSDALIQIQADLRWMRETFEKRISHLEDNNLWITRLVIGTIVTAMIGAIIILGK